MADQNLDRVKRLNILNKMLSEFKTVGGLSLRIAPTPMALTPMSAEGSLGDTRQAHAPYTVDDSLKGVFQNVSTALAQTAAGVAQATATTRQQQSQQQAQAAPPVPPAPPRPPVPPAPPPERLPYRQGEGFDPIAEFGQAAKGNRQGELDPMKEFKDLLPGSNIPAIAPQGLEEVKPGDMGDPKNILAKLGSQQAADFVKTATGDDAMGQVVGKVADIGQKAFRAFEGDPMAMAELGKEAIELVRSGMKKIWHEMVESLNSAWKAVQSERAGDVAAHAFESAEHQIEMVKPLAGPVGEVAQRFATLGKYMSQALEGLRKWNEGLHSSNMRFSEFSGGMAMVQAEQEARDIQLSMKRGDTRAGSARSLAESMSRLERRLAPFEDIWAVLKNRVTAFVTDKTAASLTGLSKVAEEILAVITAGKDGSPINAGDAMAEVGAEKWYEAYGRPERR